MNNEYVTLETFLNNCDSSSDKGLVELQKLFLNMDKKMHIYHQNNCIIDSFRLQDILVYNKADDNGNLGYDVVFLKYEQVNGEMQEMIQKNIFYAGCLAVGTYNNCLSYIDPDHPDFLKNHFNLFAENMPTEVVPYYRGVIERNATVYLESFDNLRKQKEIEAMRMQEEAAKIEAEKRKAQNNKPAKTSINNDKWGTSEAAFVGLSFFPFIIVLLGTLIPIIIGILA